MTRRLRSSASDTPTAASQRRRARRFAVRLHTIRGRGQSLVLRRLLGPSSWRCNPHAGSHSEREARD